jgi:xanthine dehydrogenase accessory factor
MEDIFEEIARIKQEGGKGALATLVQTKGATPREPGAKMLMLADGTMLGSIGGGCVEAEVWQEAKKVIAEGKPRMMHFDLTGRDAAESDGLICGGIMDVFVEPILSQPVLYIFGAGHISFFIARVGKMVGFKVAVIDDRADFANERRFPEVDEILAEDFDAVFSRLKINRSAHIVIVTRGHLSDEKVLEWAMGTEAAYIGMIGSRKKNKTVFDNLMARGVPKEALDRVCAPIGLDIGAETPEEIALSIGAQLVQVRRAQS